MDKLNELNDLLKFANLNSKQKDEDEYYIRLQGLIKFELVSILPYEIKEKYGFEANAIVSMADVVEYLYNKPYQGKIYIDDELKASIDSYYERYGVK